jgi:CBS domain containing-hemolysin-like protein
LNPSLPIGPILASVAAAAIGSLFATGDAALNALPEARLRTLTQGTGPEAVPLRRYTKDRVRVLSRWLVGRIVAISLAAALVDEAVERTGTLAGLGVLVAVLVAVVIYGTLTEILGTVARRRPEQVATFALRFLWPLEWAMVPLAEPLAMIGRFMGRRFPARPMIDAAAAETEVEWVVSEGERTGAIANEPAEMIRNVLDFKDLIIKDVMIPRRRASGIDMGTSLTDVIEMVSTEGHSRYPVFRETLDNVVGLLYAKDLFKVVREGHLGTAKLTDLIRMSVLFVLETQPAASVLREMRAKSLHMAVVSDEFGGTSGIVTLEDILEEIVGDIRDEHDLATDAQIQQIGDGRFVVDAAVSLSDLAERIGKDLPANGEFESVGGLLIDRAGRVPEVGAVLQLDGVRFVVREADETRVVKVEIDASEDRPTQIAGPAS